MNTLARTVLTICVLSAATAAWAQTNYDTSPPAQTGAQVYGSYFGTDIDTIGLYNGNLSLSIPLFSLPGRELPYGLTLTYNQQKWEADTCSGSPCGRYTGGWQKANVFGSAPSFFAQFVDCEYNPSLGFADDKFDMNVYWIDGSGAKHRYKVTGWSAVYGCYSGAYPPTNWDNLTLNSLDSDGSTFWTGNYMSYGTDPARINFKNGHIRYFRDHGATSPSYDYATPNGNYLTNGTVGSSPYGTKGLPTQDTLGRSVGYTCCSFGSESYTVTDSNGTNQTYTLNWAQLPNILDPYAGTTGWLTNYELTSIVLPNGKSYTFQYSHPQGFLTQVTLPSGAYIKYVYPAYPNNQSPYYDQVIERHVSADGTVGGEKVWTYSGYAGLGGSPGSRTVTVTSPSPVSDKVVHSFNAQGQEQTTQWQTSSSVTLKSVNSTWTQLAVESNQQPNNPQVNTIATYQDGTLFSTHSITYDSNMNVTQDLLVEGAGITVKNQKDITYQTITGNYKRPATETLTAIDPVSGSFVLQGKTVYAYDEYTLTVRSSVPNHNGNSSQTGRGNLTSITRYKDASNSVIDHMKYDNVGNVIEKDDALAHATLIDFTDNFTSGTHTTFAYPTKITNALSQYSTTQYDFNTGLPKQSTDLRGNSTTTVYDLLNRVTSVTEPNGKVTGFTYDDTNRITTKKVSVDVAGLVGGNPGQVKIYFDGLYRVTQTRTNDPEGEYAVDAVYDAKGRKSQVSNPYRVSGGTQIWTTTTYDALDRPTQVQAPDSSTLQYGYAYNQTTTTDEAGNQRRYTYNMLGQMTMVEENLQLLINQYPNPVYTTPLVTTYSYYAFGSLYQSNQSGQTRTFVNDWLGRLTSQTLPESGTTTFAYDDASRLTSKTDARIVTGMTHVTTTFTYDNANRPTGKSYNDGVTPTVGWAYDASGYTGLKTSMTDGLGAVSYSYDNMNRLTQESRSLTGIGTFNTSYGYNIKGDMTSMTYPSGRVVNFNYNTGGGCCNSRLASVVDQTTSTTLNSSMNFDAAGNLLNSTLGNGVVQTFGYNNRLQQTSITATLSSTTLMSFTYNYGTSSTNTGRLLSRTDSVQPEHSAAYVYDSIYRLSQVIASDSDTSWGEAWTFDVWGNRLTQTPLGLASGKVGTQTIGYTNNRNNANTYDAAGNQTADGSHTYGFNAENQITSMDGGAATYAYDGDGRRTKKLTSTETTYTFYGPGGVISEFTTSNTNAMAASSSDRCFYHTADKLGSAVLVMNSGGAVIENNRTLPYGETWLAESTPSTNDKKFTTYQRDGESGLDYAMNRYFANVAGRFQSPDQGKMHLRKPSTLNRYIYGTNDPINKTDSDGNDSEDGDDGGESTCAPGLVPMTDSSGEIVGCMNFAIGVVEPPVEGQEGSVPIQKRNDDLMGSVLLKVRELLKKPGCGDTIFAGGIAKGHDPMDVLTKIVSGERYGSLNYKNLGADFGAEETPSIPYRLILQKRVTITMNSYSDGSGKYWNDANATDDLRAIYLIHELGHAFNDLFGKGSSTIENDGTLFGKVNQEAEDRNKVRTDKCLQ